MGRRLAGFVHVTNPETGAAAVFGPDDELPAWASNAITNEKAWAGDVAGAGEGDGDVAGAGEDAGDVEEHAERSYDDMRVAELRALIGERNEGRDEADLIPDDGVKADLVAALEADDEQHGN